MGSKFNFYLQCGHNLLVLLCTAAWTLVNVDPGALMPLGLRTQDLHEKATSTPLKSLQDVSQKQGALISYEFSSKQSQYSRNYKNKIPRILSAHIK